MSKEKPQFVREVEQTLGLQCELIHDRDWMSEWYVVSPTGVRMFRIGGKDDELGMCGAIETHSIQGISEREQSRRSNRRAQERMRRSGDT